jgi:hypothetical protein
MGKLCSATLVLPLNIESGKVIDGMFAGVLSG